MNRILLFGCLCQLFLVTPLWVTPAWAGEVIVRNDKQLKAALKVIAPNTKLLIAPGDYSGDNELSGVADVTVTALDADNRPLFRGGRVGWHASRCPRLQFSHLRINGPTGNGLNIDDGGDGARTVSGVTVEDVEVQNVGPRGNCDAIKCSGLTELTIRNCRIVGWGGQGVDLVGCHKSTIANCRLEGKAGFTATAGVQMKGGSSEVTVEDCEFRDAGERPLNIGGSTGKDYFRPLDATAEARQITVRRNTIEGGMCAAAFVGVDGAEFTDNTILFPRKWLLRILQENRESQFVPCRGVVIRQNRFVFDRARVQTDINIGPDTAPESFRFEDNHWFAEDRPRNSRPQLPSTETGGSYGVDPRKS